MNKEEYLDEEKDIHNHLKKNFRLYRYIYRVTRRKIKKLNKLESKLSELTELKNEEDNRIFFKKWFSKKSFSGRKDEVWNKIKKLKLSLLVLTKRQEKFMMKDIEIEEDEEKMIGNVLEMPFFKKNELNPNEKELIEELVYKEKENIIKMLQISKNFLSSIKNQRKLINNIIPYKEVNDILNDEIKELKGIYGWEKKAMASCKLKTNDLIEESKRILKENKKIEKFFNPYDLKELKDLLGVELKRQSDRLNFLRTFLKDQRRLRKNIKAKNLVACHKTRTFPKRAIIRTKGQFISYLGREYTMKVPRETIHLSLNGPVINHAYGNWSHAKYGILIPVKEIKHRIINFLQADTMVFGQLPLPKGTEMISKYKYIKKYDPYIFKEVDKKIQKSKKDLRKGNLKLKEYQNKVDTLLKKPLEEFEKKHLTNKLGIVKIVLNKKNESLDEAILRRIDERGFTRMKLNMHGWRGFYSKKDIEILAKELSDEIKAYIPSYSDVNKSKLKANYIFNHINKAHYELADKLNISSGQDTYLPFGLGIVQNTIYAYEILIGKKASGEPVKLEDINNALKKVNLHMNNIKDLENLETKYKYVFKSPEEKAAYKRIINLLEKLKEGLKRKKEKFMAKV